MGSLKIAWKRFVVSALYRACRAAAIAFVATIIEAWIAGTGGLSITSLVDAIEAHADRAGGTAVLAFLLSMGWRLGLDRLPIPSLRDAPIPAEFPDPVELQPARPGEPLEMHELVVAEGQKPFVPGTGV